MNSQYINQYNQSTVETVTAISNMFFKQKSEIKHMYTIGVVVIKMCAFVCFFFVFFFCLMYYDPDNTIEVISSRSMSLLELFLGRRRLPKIKSTVYKYINPSCVSVREGMAIY